MLGLKRKLPWPVVGRLAALTAVYAIEQHGPQQHAYTLPEFVARYRENFGASPEIDELASGVPRRPDVRPASGLPKPGGAGSLFANGSG